MELQPADLTELFLYFSSTFLYLLGPLFQAIDPSCSAPELSRKKQIFDLLENKKYYLIHSIEKDYYFTNIKN